MSITSEIQKIIDRRTGKGDYEGKGHITVIDQHKTFFQELEQILKDYQTFHSNVLHQIAEESGEYYVMSIEDPTFAERVRKASPDQAIAKVEACLKECERLERRFNRNSINISVIGRARQGKSRLLQSISGLKNEIIPAADGADCTGAKSVICNAKGPVRAEIEFYSERELVDQVQKYLDSIGINKIIGSISDIKNLKSTIESFDAKKLTSTEGSRFGHLKKYVLYYDEYCNFIGTTQRVNNESDIRSYVAQYDTNSYPTYKFLGVKEARIYTEFTYPDAGKIVLIDTIGLGDTSLGIREKMLDTLKNDSDAAILVRLPAATGDGIRIEDDELYDLICGQMGKAVLDKWLFFALNVCDVLNNLNAGHAMEKNLRDKALNFAFIQRVNCGDKSDVEEKLLIPILQYLSKNLIEVDNNLLINANMLFTQAYNEFFSLCDKMRGVINSTFKANNSMGEIFDDEYEKFLKLSLPPQLNQLNEKYRGKTEECKIIRNEIHKVLQTLIDFCPEKETILERLNSGGIDAHPDNVLNYYSDSMRASICDKFEEINSSTIVELQEGIKQEILKILYSKDGGKLGTIPISETIGDDNILEWCKAFIDEKLEDFPVLKEAISNILNYRLSIEGLLEYRVNCSLECMDPTSSTFKRPNFQGQSPENCSTIIEQTLMNSIPEIANTLDNSISDLLFIPYHSFYARIRKLRECLIFSEEGRRELRKFYREYSAVIWKEKFQAAIGKETAMGEWDNYNTLMNEKRNKNLFTIKLENI